MFEKSPHRNFAPDQLRLPLTPDLHSDQKERAIIALKGLKRLIEPRKAGKTGRKNIPSNHSKALQHEANGNALLLYVFDDKIFRAERSHWERTISGASLISPVYRAVIGLLSENKIPHTVARLDPYGQVWAILVPSKMSELGKEAQLAVCKIELDAERMLDLHLKRMMDSSNLPITPLRSKLRQLPKPQNRRAAKIVNGESAVPDQIVAAIEEAIDRAMALKQPNFILREVTASTLKADSDAAADSGLGRIHDPSICTLWKLLASRSDVEPYLQDNFQNGIRKTNLCLSFKLKH